MSTATPAYRPKNWQMILYSSGSLASALSYQAFSTYIQFLYIDILGLKAAWVGVAWAIYGIWNAINDPLAGYWSDRTHTRWGRRIPWIAASFIPMAITFYLLWVPPAGLTAGRGSPLMVYFLTLVLAFDLLWTIVVMNWTSLFPEMVPDEKQRASVSAWRQVFSVIGLLVGVALPPILAGEDWSGRGGVAVILAIPTALFFGLSLLGSRERREFQHDEPLPFKQALRATFRNRNFLYFLGANLCVQFVFNMMTASEPFYAKYALRIQQSLTIPGLGITLGVGLQNSLLLGAAFIIAIPAMPVWTALVHRLGNRTTLRLACLTSALALFLLFFPKNFYTGIVCTTFFGMNLAGLLMLPDLFLADVVDADELETGVRREGMYFGINGLIIRFAFTIQGLITGAVLTLTRYVSPGGGFLYPEQPRAAVMGMRVMMGGIPAIALLIAFFVIGGYTLHHERLQEIHARTKALHAQKALTGNNG